MIELEQKIRERAYQIWEQEGRVHGCDEQHWHRAKLELADTVDDVGAVAIETAAATAEPVKKSRRSAKPKAEASVPAIQTTTPRRRRSQAPMQ